jgi:hypothetical protein
MCSVELGAGERDGVYSRFWVLPCLKIRKKNQRKFNMNYFEN